MKNLNIKTSVFYMPAIVILMTLIGCAVQRPPISPYSDWYDNKLKSVQMPNAETIKKVGTKWTFSKPIEEVWRACLHVSSQYEGILGFESEKGVRERLIFVNGHEMLLRTASFGFHPNKNMTYYKFLDTWIAIAVTSEEGGNRTTVAAAWVSPETGAVTPFGMIQPQQDSDAEAPQAPQAQTTSLANLSQRLPVQNFDVIGSALSEERSQIAMGFNKIQKPIDRWEFVPQATINEFFYHLATQLFGPERWQKKFVTESSETIPRPLREIKEIDKKSGFDEYAELENETGNWASAVLRRKFLVVHAPIVGAELQKIVDRLKIVAQEEDRQIKVYIIASPEINAFTLPNGDIFILTGLLEAVDSKDEIAAVLGHELDHFFQHDTTTGLKNKRNARIATTSLQIVGAMVGAGAGVAAGGGAMAATYGTQTVSQQLAQTIVENSISSLSGIIGESVGNEMVTGHSQAAELRADFNSARYLWAAGYDVEAEISLLMKLQELKVQAQERNEQISSGFINAKPGLETRIEEMKINFKKLENNKGE